MSRPNAFGVIERILNMQDSLTEAHRENTQLRAQYQAQVERVARLQKEIQGLNDLLQLSFTEKRHLLESIEATDGCTPHPSIPEATATVYSGEAKPLHNEHQE